MIQEDLNSHPPYPFSFLPKTDPLRSVIGNEIYIWTMKLGEKKILFLCCSLLPIKIND